MKHCHSWIGLLFFCSFLFFCNAQKTAFVTGISGKEYLTIKIGNQWWMAEDLCEIHYDTQSESKKILIDSRCLIDEPCGFIVYHRGNENTIVMYNWSAALGLTENNSVLRGLAGIRQGICPNGWHIPNRSEWEELRNYAQEEYGGNSAKHLKSTSGWERSGNGTNYSGFNVYPYGRPIPCGKQLVGSGPTTYREGYYSGFYSYNNLSENEPLFINFTYYDDYLMKNEGKLTQDMSIEGKKDLHPVRCIKDDTTILATDGNLIEINKNPERDFFVQNKLKADIVETKSGLQYKVIKMGNGRIPFSSEKVKVHYIGRFLDENVFDSSVERGEPLIFPLDQVISGCIEGIQLMPVGSKFIFYIPSWLAYGDRGLNGIIKPNATLIFEIELLDILGK